MNTLFGNKISDIKRTVYTAISLTMQEWLLLLIPVTNAAEAV